MVSIQVPSPQVCIFVYSYLWRGSQKTLSASILGERGTNKLAWCGHRSHTLCESILPPSRASQLPCGAKHKKDTPRQTEALPQCAHTSLQENRILREANASGPPKATQRKYKRNCDQHLYLIGFSDSSLLKASLFKKSYNMQVADGGP